LAKGKGQREDMGKTIVSRQNAKAKTTNPKLEIRNFETNSNDQKSEISKTKSFWIFGIRVPIEFPFVSDFDIRISNFASATPWRDKCFLPPSCHRAQEVISRDRFLPGSALS
jgi:hypothetical protein